MRFRHICAGALRRTVFALAALAAGAMPVLAGDEAGQRPARVVSINMCTDELLLRLADPDRIASVTWLSQDPRNANMADEARRHPANHGLAEEVLAYRPDLVLAGRYTSRATVALLRRLGVRVVDVGVSRSLAEVRANIRDVARLLGEGERGDALIRAMDDRMAQDGATPAASRPLAIVLRPNGFTAAKGSLVDDIIDKAGMANLAARLDIANYAQVPLETLVLQGADVLIMDGELGNGPAQAMEILHHPVIARLAGRLKVVSLPSRLWTCAGPGVVDAVERLRAAAPDHRS